MKVILSRKGFDSSAGGVPSPIIDGHPVSLPIPTKMPSPTRYCDVHGAVAELVVDLSNNRIKADAWCHLDPDLAESHLSRSHGWRGALGQAGAAQSHLTHNGVGPGDVFLFWGLFRAAVRNRSRGTWQFVGEREHRIFGWLQVDEVLDVGTNPAAALNSHPWLMMHPHASAGWSRLNSIYVGRELLALPGRQVQQKGYGLFRSGSRLTEAESKLPSQWSVPSWMNPKLGGVGLTYHPLERWGPNGTLAAAARGQEFVADIGDRSDAFDWLTELFGEEG